MITNILLFLSLYFTSAACDGVAGESVAPYCHTFLRHPKCKDLGQAWNCCDAYQCASFLDEPVCNFFGGVFVCCG